MGCTVREAVRGDAPDLARLLTQLGYPAARDEVDRRLSYWLPDPMSIVLVAEHDGNVTGCLSMHAIPYLEHSGRWARIESLVVDETARRTGTGRALVAAAEQVARRWDCLIVEVTSLRTRTDAHAFYRKLGYADACRESGLFCKALTDAGTPGRQLPGSQLDVPDEDATYRWLSWRNSRG